MKSNQLGGSHFKQIFIIIKPVSDKILVIISYVYLILHDA